MFIVIFWCYIMYLKCIKIVSLELILVKTLKQSIMHGNNYLFPINLQLFHIVKWKKSLNAK